MNPSPRLRIFTAYSTAGQILTRYLLLWILKKLTGAKLTALTERAHKKNAAHLLKSILKLKGIFIKMGQGISIMTTFLPSAYTEGLEGLQDAVPPHPYEAIEKRFLEEFGKKPEEIFLNFDREAIASASLGQVHAATLPDGARIAVKIQYPEIESLVHADLKTLRRIFGFLHLLFPHYGLKQTYAELSSIILLELDFKNEGKNLETICDNFKEESDFLFSKVYWEYSTGRILTLEFMEGVKISNVQKLKEAGISPTEVARKIIHAYCKQIFIDGIYHADPHPGNFLIQSGPKIIMMDFGAVARISDNMRKGVAVFIEGLIRRDNRIISQAMKDMGFIAKSENEQVFDRIVEFFYDRLKDVKLEDVQGLRLDGLGNIQDLFEFRKLDVSFGELLSTFNVPKDWALMERSLILLFGLTTHLDPTLNPLSIIIPYAEQFVLGKDKKLGDMVVEAVKEVGLSYLRLPHEVLKTLRRLNQGELEFSSKSTEKSAPLLAKTIQQLNRTLLLIASGLTAYLFYKDGIWDYHYPLYACGAIGVWWLGSVLVKK